MKKYILLICLGLNLVQAQVVIGDDASTAHPNSVLTLNNTSDDPQNAKGLILPSVDHYSKLPLYDPNEPDLFRNDSSYEGMLMYIKNENDPDHNYAVYYNGQKWVSAFSDGRNLRTQASIAPNTPTENLPVTVCVLVGCDEAKLKFSLNNNEFDVDELKILLPGSSENNFKIRSTGLYKVDISVSFNTSGVHVTPPQISIQTLKNGVIAGQVVANMNTLLVSGNAPMTASTSMFVWAEGNDELSISVGGAIPILTIADTYRVNPNKNTYVIIERIL